MGSCRTVTLYYHGQIFAFPAQIPIDHKGHEVTQRKFGMIVFPRYLCAAADESRFSLVLLCVLCGSCLWLRLRRAVALWCAFDLWLRPQLPNYQIQICTTISLERISAVPVRVKFYVPNQILPCRLRRRVCLSFSVRVRPECGRQKRAGNKGTADHGGQNRHV